MIKFSIFKIIYNNIYYFQNKKKVMKKQKKKDKPIGSIIQRYQVSYQ